MPKNAKCFVCGAGPQGLRAYETVNTGSSFRAVRFVCAEWLTPCWKRPNAFGRAVRARTQERSARRH
jgi:hypothetical protein